MSNEWHTSGYSQNGGQCVEVMEGSDATLVRDSQNRAVSPLRFPSAEWAAFLSDVKRADL